MSICRFSAAYAVAVVAASIVGCGGGDPDPPPQTGDSDNTQLTSADAGHRAPPANGVGDSGRAAKDEDAAKATVKPPDEAVPPPETGLAAAVVKERSVLLADLLSDRPGARDAAIARLDQAGGEAKQTAANLLQSASPRDVRLGAAFYLLERFDEVDEVQVRGIVAALEDEDPAIRNIGLQVVLRSKAMTIANLETVGNLMIDSAAAASSRVKAIRGMASMPEEAARVLPKIRSAAKDAAEESVRQAAVYTLSRVDESPEGVAAIVDRLANDSAPAVRQLAAARLGRMETSSGVSALAAALKDGDSRVRQSAADSLGRLGEGAIGPLITALQGESVEARRLAVYALGKNGAAAARAIPELQRAAEKDADPKVRELAKLTIRVIQTAD